MKQRVGYLFYERGETRKHRVREEAEEYAHNYLSTHPCIECGESNPRMLEFRYIGGKGWIISNLVGGGNALVAIQAEIAKCIVLCANCSRKKGMDELGRSQGGK